MKMNSKLRRILLTVCSAALLVCVTVGATVAYLTSSDEVTNTFVVGNVTITLDEAKINEAGKPVKVTQVEENGEMVEKLEEVENAADATRVDGNSYHLFPSHEYTKDPTIHVKAGSEKCWLFVKVENGIKDIEDATTNIAAQLTANGWSLVSGTENVYSYKNIIDAATATTDTDVTVFEKIKIADTVDGTTLASYASKTVKVTAYAIQADGFTTAEDAWTTAGSSF